MDEGDIYGDLDGVDLGNEVENLREENQSLSDHIKHLEEDIDKLCDKISQLEQEKFNLAKNISELYLTAKSEIQRKDKRLLDLQAEYDSLLFKRNGKRPHDHSNDSYSKRFKKYENEHYIDRESRITNKNSNSPSLSKELRKENEKHNEGHNFKNYKWKNWEKHKYQVQCDRDTLCNMESPSGNGKHPSLEDSRTTAVDYSKKTSQVSKEHSKSSNKFTPENKNKEIQNKIKELHSKSEELQNLLKKRHSESIKKSKLKEKSMSEIDKVPEISKKENNLLVKKSPSHTNPLRSEYYKKYKIKKKVVDQFEENNEINSPKEMLVNDDMVIKVNSTFLQINHQDESLFNTNYFLKNSPKTVTKLNNKEDSNRDEIIEKIDKTNEVTDETEENFSLQITDEEDCSQSEKLLTERIPDNLEKEINNETNDKVKEITKNSNLKPENCFKKTVDDQANNDPQRECPIIDKNKSLNTDRIENSTEKPEEENVETNKTNKDRTVDSKNKKDNDNGKEENEKKKTLNEKVDKIEEKARVEDRGQDENKLENNEKPEDKDKPKDDKNKRPDTGKDKNVGTISLQETKRKINEMKKPLKEAHISSVNKDLKAVELLLGEEKKFTTTNDDDDDHDYEKQLIKLKKKAVDEGNRTAEDLLLILSLTPEKNKIPHVNLKNKIVEEIKEEPPKKRGRGRPRINPIIEKKSPTKQKLKKIQEQKKEKSPILRRSTRQTTTRIKNIDQENTINGSNSSKIQEEHDSMMFYLFGDNLSDIEHSTSDLLTYETGITSDGEIPTLDNIENKIPLENKENTKEKTHHNESPPQRPPTPPPPPPPAPKRRPRCIISFKN